jgi:hypothetical protein
MDLIIPGRKRVDIRGGESPLSMLGEVIGDEIVGSKV